MRILISGVCGFVGSSLAECLLERVEGIRIAGIDNLMRSSTLPSAVRLCSKSRRLLPEPERPASTLGLAAASITQSQTGRPATLLADLRSP